jgi:hypothetical protein
MGRDRPGPAQISPSRSGEGREPSGMGANRRRVGWTGGADADGLRSWRAVVPARRLHAPAFPYTAYCTRE